MNELEEWANNIRHGDFFENEYFQTWKEIIFEHTKWQKECEGVGENENKRTH